MKHQHQTVTAGHEQQTGSIKSPAALQFGFIYVMYRVTDPISRHQLCICMYATRQQTDAWLVDPTMPMAMGGYTKFSSL